MASLQRLDMEKLRTRRIVATASLTAIAAASLLVMCRSTAVSPTPAATSHQAAAQAPAEIQGEPVVLSLPDFQISDPISTPATHPEPSPAPQQMGPPEPPQDSSPSASEQRLFRSRRALETMDPREFVQHGR